MVPTLLIINSKEEENSSQWLELIKSAAGIRNGGSISLWVGPGTYRNSLAVTT